MFIPVILEKLPKRVFFIMILSETNHGLRKRAAALTVSAFIVGIAAVVAAPTPPNIVFIFADDMGFGDPGCYNPRSKIPTPHMDKLATGGLRFTDAHTPAVVCTPTHK